MEKKFEPGVSLKGTSRVKWDRGCSKMFSKNTAAQQLEKVSNVTKTNGPKEHKDMAGN